MSWLKVLHAGFFDRHLGLRRKYCDFFFSEKKNLLTIKPGSGSGPDLVNTGMDSNKYSSPYPVIVFGATRKVSIPVPYIIVLIHNSAVDSYPD